MDVLNEGAGYQATTAGPLAGSFDRFDGTKDLFQILNLGMIALCYPARTCAIHTVIRVF